ncbi:flagellar filament capping protein FliD [Pseudomarimonas arenosa]|uniref:Flagellar hook-associated protein 2 n=1 Tax=Pseudomarimonas arenosa TaxID=2774145 RepID=A0AAW3ZF85_9GAMM|nr:flagellar filament capping protein FliD [Pseudomarimonas arenosa]MBD8524746.1 flagellar filament capping protein FliD [Pseudomarimonas arenosa]
MGLISNVGLGSGLDISSLVQQLVDSERAGPSAALNRREARTKAQISAVAQVKSAFSQLQTAVNKLRDGAAFDARKVSSSDSDRLSASIKVGSTPALGRYTIEVESLASAQKLQSDPAAISSATDALPTGTLSFTLDGSQFDVVIAADTDIYEAAQAINQAAGGKLQASVIRGDDGFSLSLTSGVTGSAGEITISQTAGGSSLQAFTFDPNSPQAGAMDETAPASDAVLYVDGVKRTASSNSLSDVISGLDLTLKKAELGHSFTLTVAEDTSGARAAVEGFVNAYNTALKVLAQVSAYDENNNTAQALNGDAFVRNATAQLRNVLSDAFRAAASEGVKLGIDTGVDGSLSFKSADFLQGLEASPNAYRRLFAGEEAALTRGLSSYLDSVLGNNGTLIQRSESLDRALKNVTADRSALDRRLVGIEERYRKQFVALDGLLAKLNNTSQYLAQQLAGLGGSQG